MAIQHIALLQLKASLAALEHLNEMLRAPEAHENIPEITSKFLKDVKAVERINEIRELAEIPE